MRTPQRLIVIAAALALTSCTAYVRHDASPTYRSGDGEQPCPHDGRRGVIGLSIGRADDAVRGPIVVQAVASGGPADDASIQPGDRISAIDGESTRSMTVSEAAHLIRGHVNTSVELRVESPRGARLITLVRVPDVHRRGHPHGDGRRCHRRAGNPPCDHCAKGRPCDHGARGSTAPPPAVNDDAPTPED